eukprot:GHUV01045029.1.p1 GENE.GHUV01045029.1~~GHUV01045029.1.p1  ORF type:complete len:183 (-),score=31.96 GHUV01045029.1:42-590(-)
MCEDSVCAACFQWSSSSHLQGYLFAATNSQNEYTSYSAGAASQSLELPLCIYSARHNTHMGLDDSGSTVAAHRKVHLSDMIMANTQNKCTPHMRWSCTPSRVAFVATVFCMYCCRHNTHVVLDGSGSTAATYRKVHLFDVDVPNGPVLMESRTTAPGNKAGIRIVCKLSHSIFLRISSVSWQ